MGVAAQCAAAFRRRPTVYHGRYGAIRHNVYCGAPSIMGATAQRAAKFAAARRFLFEGREGRGGPVRQRAGSPEG
eukprot:10334214-Alexandrium_andersonii.AAC.1